MSPALSGRESIADWIETTILAERVSTKALAALEEQASQFADVPAQDVQLALSAIEQRRALLGMDYPFEVTPVAVKASAAARARPYSTLLLLTPGGIARAGLRQDPTPAMAKLFELLTCTAVERLLGPGGMALRFGWPSDIGRPPEFPGAVRWLAQRMGIEPGSAYRPPRRRDGGVDVVAWRPFPDGRSGFPVMLVQCTLQQNFVSKARDVDVRNWAGWLTLDADPTIVLAVPGTIPASEEWNEIAMQGLILERVRIAGLLRGLDNEAFAGAQDLVESLLSHVRPDD